MACTIQYGPTARSIFDSIEANLHSSMMDIENSELQRATIQFNNIANMTDGDSLHPIRDISAKSKSFNSKNQQCIRQEIYQSNDVCIWHIHIRGRVL